MDSGLLEAAAPVIVAGVFNLIGKRMEIAYLAGGATVPVPAGGAIVPASSGPASASHSQADPGRINYGLVLRQVGILQLVINLVAFIVGMTMGASEATPGQILVAILFIGTILLIAGFVWASLAVDRAIMWKHLAVVAVSVAIVTVILNAIILQMPLSLVVFIGALVQTFISMGIGGAIANRIRR